MLAKSPRASLAMLARALIELWEKLACSNVSNGTDRALGKARLRLFKVLMVRPQYDSLSV